jgi:hypothetical protein
LYIFEYSGPHHVDFRDATYFELQLKPVLDAEAEAFVKVPMLTHRSEHSFDAIAAHVEDASVRDFTAAAVTQRAINEYCCPTMHAPISSLLKYAANIPRLSCL